MDNATISPGPPDRSEVDPMESAFPEFVFGAAPLAGCPFGVGRRKVGFGMGPENVDGVRRGLPPRLFAWPLIQFSKSYFLSI